MTTSTTDPTKPMLIAPCGINCRVCRAYGREHKPCPGCRGDDTNKAVSCVRCRIKNCEKLAGGEFKYCFECDKFPCERVTHLDQRYRLKYGTTVIGNLRTIKKIGIRKFVAQENAKWTCPGCGSMLCMHDPRCHTCGYLWLK